MRNGYGQTEEKKEQPKWRFDIAKLVRSPNIAEMLSEDDRHSLGMTVAQNFESDLFSRADWETKTEASMKLALQVMENKNWPWPNASNVKFPLVTIAALQYHSRAYPSLVNAPDLVSCVVHGDDPDGLKTARAVNIGRHMSYQNLEEDEGWEENMDKLLMVQPIMGCAFKKTYFDPVKGHNVSELVLPKDLVVSYYTKSLSSDTRISHIIPMSSNKVHERKARGVFLDVDYCGHSVPKQEHTRIETSRQDREGVRPDETDSDTPQEFIEQHCIIDFDGDGYKEPYIVTFHRDSQKIARIVARFFEEEITRTPDNKKIICIKPVEIFTKFPFIPSPDGGFYDLGFGQLLGPINDAVDSAINQLIDAGTMVNLGGGFLGRGIKIKSGEYTFQPGEWKRVDSTGDDLGKSIFPLPVKEPSQVLFELLQLLINYAERISGATDILTGISPGQNTPAETSRTVANEGQKIFNGIFKRTYRALKSEFEKQYELNTLHLSETQSYSSLDSGKMFNISREDYVQNDGQIVPAADPNIVSDQQKAMTSQALLSMAQTMSGFDLEKVVRKVLRTMRISDSEEVYPGPSKVPPSPSEKIQLKQMEIQARKEEITLEVRIALLQLTQQAEMLSVDIEKKRAETIALLESIEDEDNQNKVNLLNAQIGAAKAQQEGFLRAIEVMRKAVTEKKDADGSVTRQVEGVAPLGGDQDLQG